VRIPEGIKNERKWVGQCCKIVARARDLLEGRLGVFEAAQVLPGLAFVTRLSKDSDILVFVAINSESVGLPTGREREQWAPHALAREDEKIRLIEARCRPKALVAAQNLVENYAWALERRAELRRLARLRNPPSK
jgi:hypothetical protein